MKDIKKILGLIILPIFFSCANNLDNAKMEMSTEMDRETEMAMELGVKEMAAPTNEQKISETIERKLIKEGEVEFETDNLNLTRKTIFEAVKKHKAYVSSDQEFKYPGKKSNTISIRVPANNFDNLLTDATQGVKKFESKEINVKDVTEEFLLELKGMKHKNIALEVLKKLLNDEIKSRAKKNLVQSKTLKEMLENSIRKYHNKILTAAEVIEELINLSKGIVEMDKEPEKMGLTDFEYAFYTAVADNDSAKELMGKEKLRELAVVLTESIRKNATIDWTIKESVKAKLKVSVKRILRRYGYPPDMQKLATDTVLKQAESIAKELASQ